MEHTLIATETLQEAGEKTEFSYLGDYQSLKIWSIILFTVWSVGYVGLELNKHQF